MTLWEISHMTFHAIIGYYFNIYISVGIGVMHEINEHYNHNAGSYLDIIWNFLGFLIGYCCKNGLCL
jgi:hypothetical protein